MTGLTALWLPILLSSVFVFIVSSILHMALPWHKGDFVKVPNEDKVRDALRGFAIPPGEYMMPHCGSSQEMKSPEFTEKLKQGPVMMMTVLPSGPFNMRRARQWFLYSSSSESSPLRRGALSRRPTTCRLPLAGCRVRPILALTQASIWNGAPGHDVKFLIDGLIYGLITAGTFGWLAAVSMWRRLAIGSLVPRVPADQSRAAVQGVGRTVRLQRLGVARR
jgi:hypothetical protein